MLVLRHELEIFLDDVTEQIGETDNLAVYFDPSTGNPTVKNDRPPEGLREVCLVPKEELGSTACRDYVMPV